MAVDEFEAGQDGGGMHAADHHQPVGILGKFLQMPQAPTTVAAMIAAQDLDLASTELATQIGEGLADAEFDRVSDMDRMREVGVDVEVQRLLGLVRGREGEKQQKPDRKRMSHRLNPGS